MPSLSISYTAAIGPIINVLIFPAGLNPPIANPQKSYTALIDTGASCTCVTAKVVADLALPPIGKQPIGGVHGPQTTNIYQFQVGIAFPSGPVSPNGVVNAAVIPFSVTGSEFVSGGAFDVLLGRDVLCKGAFSMSFDGHAIFSV